MDINTLKEIFTHKIFMDIFFNFLAFLTVIIVTILIIKGTKNVMNRSYKLKELDPTQFIFLKHFLLGIIYFFGILAATYTIPVFRSLVVSIFAGSGVLAIIIGFASQQAFSNIVSGIFIAIFKPFRIGDRINFIGKNTFGIVEDITLRHTLIRTFENKRVVVPNSVISNEIIENSDIIEDKVCNHIEMGISYDSNIDKAMEIIKDEAINHEYFMDNRTLQDINSGEPIVDIKVVKFGDSSVNLKAWVWTKDSASGFKLKCDLNKSIKERFDVEGIEIPFPYRTIVFKNKNIESLNGEEL
jgi:small-conductance mechanosensitive channel